MYIYEWRYLNADGNQMTMNQMARAMNYWKQPGDTGCNPKPVAGNTTQSMMNSTRWIQRGDYLRIKSITVGYTLPKKYTKKALMEEVRFSVSGQNLYTFTRYKGLDPEVGGSGIDSNVYPLTRNFTFGLNIMF